MVIAEPTPEVVLGRHLHGIPGPDRPVPVPVDGVHAVVGCLPVALGAALAAAAGALVSTLLLWWLAGAAAAIVIAVAALLAGVIHERRTVARVSGRISYRPLPTDLQPASPTGLVLRRFNQCWTLLPPFSAACGAVGGVGLARVAALGGLIWFGRLAGYWALALAGTARDQRRRGCRMLMPVSPDPGQPVLYLEDPAAAPR